MLHGFPAVAQKGLEIRETYMYDSVPQEVSLRQTDKENIP